MADAGRDRPGIQAETGQVLGVHDCTLQVDDRVEIVVLMGLSGSGKSTLLRAVNGLNPVARGRVLVRDGGESVDVTTCSAARLRRAAADPHRDGLPAVRTVAVAQRGGEYRARAGTRRRGRPRERHETGGDAS